MKDRRIASAFIIAAMLLVSTARLAWAQDPEESGVDINVQKGDNLWTWAEKCLGNGGDWIKFVEATKIKHKEDSSYANPDLKNATLIHQGNKYWGLCGHDYVVVDDDWLSKVAEKNMGNSMVSLSAIQSFTKSIVECTNLKHAQDATYAEIRDADQIEAGWKVFIPDSNPCCGCTNCMSCCQKCGCAPPGPNCEFKQVQN